jgi:hypothetical protein
MYLVRKIYEVLKATPTAVYQTAFCAAILATATHMATKPSELEKKAVEQKNMHPSNGGGSYGATTVCPPVMPNYKYRFEEK